MWRIISEIFITNESRYDILTRIIIKEGDRIIDIPAEISRFEKFIDFRRIGANDYHFLKIINVIVIFHKF